MAWDAIAFCEMLAEYDPEIVPIRRDGRKLKPPMDFGSYRRMMDLDLNTIVAYL